MQLLLSSLYFLAMLGDHMALGLGACWFYCGATPLFLPAVWLVFCLFVRTSSSLVNPFFEVILQNDLK